MDLRYLFFSFRKKGFKMKKTTNCHIRDNKMEVYCGRGKGIKNDPNNCKVGESGWLGSPIVIGRKCKICNLIHYDPGSTLPCYEKYLLNKLKKDLKFKEEFFKLKGKTLGCFCKPQPCHTDIMIQYLEGLKEI